MTDHPAADTTRHWTTKVHPLTGILTVDGQEYRFLGAPSVIPGVKGNSQMADLKGTNILPTRTVHSFICGGTELTVTYMAPLLADDFALLSRPVNYITWKVKSIDGKEHKCTVRMEASPRIAINREMVPVTAITGKESGINYACTGTAAQPVLATRGDDVRIDWGYLYLAAPEEKGKISLSNGKSSFRSDDFEKSKLALTYTEELGKVGDHIAEGYLMIGYDDIWSIEYLGQRLRPWWNRSGNNTILREFGKAAAEKGEIEELCSALDAKVTADAMKAGGQHYADLCALAWRQVMAAHKLVASPDGHPWFISKENNSNGCAGTVDVTYPSIPMLLLYNQNLAKATIDFVFDYCRTPAWKDQRKATWATHDIGVYPQAYGQHYGSWMALEECGNLLILTAAMCAMDGSSKYAESHWEDLTLWTLFLVANGMNPENQLCTDDFAGKLAHNVNLSAKSIIGIAAYARMAEQLGKKDEAAAFRRKAEEMAAKWKEMALDTSEALPHYRLTFDKEGTWSTKYNLVWDRVLGLNVFESDIIPTEIDYYLTKQNRYGLPLDWRKEYTKTDWILWTAALSPDRDTFEKFIDPVWDFYNETVDRLPMGDWVDTDAPTHRAMYARSVVGGFYMKLLADRLNKPHGPRIVYMGDSITDGSWGRAGGSNKPAEQRSEWDKNHVFGHGYMEMCAGWYMSHYPEADYEFHNRGISGYRLDDLEERWQKDVVEMKPDVLSVLIGTNDLHSYVSGHLDDSEFDYAGWKNRYRALLDKALEANPDVTIVLCTPFIVKAGYTGRSETWRLKRHMTDRIVAIVKELAAETGATLVDFDALFKELYATTDTAEEYWSWDGIHPTTAAHQKMADLWIETVKMK